MDQELKAHKWQLVAKFGLIYTLLSVALNLLAFITGSQLSMKFVNSLLNFIVVFGSMYFGMLAIRNEVTNGFASYGDCLKSGVQITVAASVLLTIYFYVFITFIDVDFIDNLMTESKKQLIESGATEDEIEQQMNAMSMVRSPWVLSIGGFLGNFFYGFVASLIIAFFVKRDDPDAAYKSLE
ncbi:MAG: DUF4199 domain-containing protein [Bacteroidia bacterium]|nr:DUF4199 domain-containing protein [Bacteroidia bacterium]